MTYVLDRFEEDFAVFLSDSDGRQLILPRADFEERREGDVFKVSDTQALVFDAALTMARREAAKERFSRLVKRKPKLK